MKDEDAFSPVSAAALVGPDIVLLFHIKRHMVDLMERALVFRNGIGRRWRRSDKATTMPCARSVRRQALVDLLSLCARLN